MAEHVRYRKPRNPTQPASSHNPDRDPNSSRSKPTISSILLSSGPINETNSKKKNFSSTTFRGLGCTASSQVSVPAVIRTSANWEAKKLKKKRLKTKKSGNDKLPMNNSSAAAISNSNPSPQSSISLALSSRCVGVPDVWCGPGMGLTTDAASVDCVVSRRPPRGKVDGVDRIFLGQREGIFSGRSVCLCVYSSVFLVDLDFALVVDANVALSREMYHFLRSDID
ncbi:hypothetical protein Sango_0030000 [Sesamum angolense]|uniref:Uncharacterized protein n=1 Tax=Sesamum angolense TaxID=2727404 RepID=A0AAE1XD34_9LAMI|nr:hypothetical protein Sango_0030000 [Sesamum angolense]